MSLMLPNEALGEKHITRPFLAICEGMSDATFVCRLLRHQQIENCSVSCPSDKNSGGQGDNRISSFLSAIRAITKGRSVLRGVAVVVDADQSSQKKLSIIKKAFIDAEFPAPRSAYRVYDKEIRVAIYMIPGKGKRGTLEHLLLEAALSRRPRISECLDEFCVCTKKVKNWKSNERAKMKLSALVAATCQKNPWASANTMWSYKGCPVPIGSIHFNEIREFLIEFTAPIT